MENYPYVCIVGAPRSGTTILGDVLSQHPDIGHLFEPYFIWDHHYGPLENDIRTSDMATPEIATWIRREFGIFLRKSGRKMLLDKSPFSSFRIPFVNKVFPNGKFIHLVRDGREVSLSTFRKWLERNDYTAYGNYHKFIWEVYDKLRKRPYLRTRLLAILYELRFNFRLKLKNFYAGYYDGKPGWGVRYPGFEKDMKSYTLLQFNALQWLHSVAQIEKDLAVIPDTRKLTIRYEDFLLEPGQTVSKILSYIDLPESDSVDIGRVKTEYKKTREISNEQLEEIVPLIRGKLADLGYI